MTETATTTQVHRVFIKATPQAIWDAITDPEWNARYGYECPSEYELRPGGSFRGLSNAAMREHGAPEVIIEGEVLEVDPPRRLVQTWHALFDPETVAEGPRTLTWEIDEQPSGLCRLTVTHDVTDAPKTSEQVGGDRQDAGGGWPWIISDLKTLLETGASLGS